MMTTQRLLEIWKFFLNVSWFWRLNQNSCYVTDILFIDSDLLKYVNHKFCDFFPPESRILCKLNDVKVTLYTKRWIKIQQSKNIVFITSLSRKRIYISKTITPEFVKYILSLKGLGFNVIILLSDRGFFFKRHAVLLENNVN